MIVTILSFEINADIFQESLLPNKNYAQWYHWGKKWTSPFLPVLGFWSVEVCQGGDDDAHKREPQSAGLRRRLTVVLQHTVTIVVLYLHLLVTKYPGTIQKLCYLRRTTIEKNHDGGGLMTHREGNRGSGFEGNSPKCQPTSFSWLLLKKLKPACFNQSLDCMNHRAGLMT